MKKLRITTGRRSCLCSWILIAGITVVSAAFAGGCSGVDDSAEPVIGSQDLSAGAEHSGVSMSGMDFSYSDRDLDQGFNKEIATVIDLNDGETAISGSGATLVKENGSYVLELTEEKAYFISGVLTNGSIRLDLGREGKAEIALAGVDITSADSPPMYIKEADKVFVTMYDGSYNCFNDRPGDRSVNPKDKAGSIGKEIGGAVFCMADLTFRGTGVLEVNSTKRAGIVSKDDMLLTGGTLIINSPKDGIKANDRVQMHDGSLMINAGDDGISVGNDDNDNLGYAAIENGKVQITSGCDGIKADSVIRIGGGDIQIKTGGGFGESKYVNDGSDNLSESKKGLNAQRLIFISKDADKLTMNLDTADDAFHSGNDIEVNEGAINIKSGDRGLHADASAYINGGGINIDKCYEGIEGSEITITGGLVSIVSNDDGLSASGGSDRSSLEGHSGQGEFRNPGRSVIKLKGGYVTTDTFGDCVDSYGDISIEGGVLLSSVSGVMENTGIAAAGKISITGGRMLICGETNMAARYNAESTVNTIQFYLDRKMIGGTAIALTDDESKVIASFKPANRFSTVIVSSPEITNGKKYAIYKVQDQKNVNADGYILDNGSALTADSTTKLAESGEIGNIITVVGKRKNAKE